MCKLNLTKKLNAIGTILLSFDHFAFSICDCYTFENSRTKIMIRLIICLIGYAFTLLGLFDSSLFGKRIKDEERVINYDDETKHCDDETKHEEERKPIIEDKNKINVLEQWLNFELEVLKKITNKDGKKLSTLDKKIKHLYYLKKNFMNLI